MLHSLSLTPAATRRDRAAYDGGADHNSRRFSPLGSFGILGLKTVQQHVYLLTAANQSKDKFVSFTNRETDLPAVPIVLDRVHHFVQRLT